MDDAADKTWVIHRGDEQVGTACLSWHDAGMNVRGGEFVPGPGYSAVQPVFQLFAESDQNKELMRQYYAARDALGLAVTDEKGDRVQGTVHILDFTKGVPGVPLEVEILPPIETGPSNKPIQPDGPSGRR